MYCSRYLSDDEAAATLLSRLDGEALAAPRTLRFRTGVRRGAWHRNCLAIGPLGRLSFEPLESTSIHLIQSGISRLLTFFPAACRASRTSPNTTASPGASTSTFATSWCCTTTRSGADDSPLWNQVRTMSIPESLAQKMALFRTQGRLYGEADELFAQGSWTQVMMGQGLRPGGYNPIVDVVGDDDVAEFIEGIRVAIDHSVARMPTHEQFIAANCKRRRRSAAPRPCAPERRPSPLLAALPIARRRRRSAGPHPLRS